MEPTPLPTVTAVPDWDELAKSIIRVDFKQEDCEYSHYTYWYNVSGSVTNISDKYPVENVLIRMELYGENGNLLMADESYADAFVLGPGTKADFDGFIFYREVNNPTCKVFVKSASIAP